ncbi:hypothetical protein B0J11DRAFT_586186 [Dendryphion nanum]|uniref:Uncharacterized protein n=1 Tax=Dendryphion nanum TaxID=256645 RepID=A0A9P9D1A1_9PLEO|nr:hypothetical protein B0J11DRAFT_586186 [Dendryphion nanum]
MKFTSTNIFITTALLASASAQSNPNLSATYQIQVLHSTNPRINSSFLAVKNPKAGTEPNALGVWSTGEPRFPFQLTLAKATTDTRFFKLNGALRQTHLFVTGKDSIKGLFDGAIGSKVELKANETYYDDKWTFIEMGGPLSLRHAQDHKTVVNATGGAGSWRACRGDSEVDYQMYWYDGRSPLEIKNCEGITLQLVESTPQSSATATSVIGLPSPIRTSAAASGTIGLPSPSRTGSGNATNTGSPTQFPGAGSNVNVISGLTGLVLGAMAIFV